MSTITIYPQNILDQPITVSCPDGEAFYWARQIRKHAGPGLIQFTGEVARTPYLGYVALPSDELAMVKLIAWRVNGARR